MCYKVWWYTLACCQSYMYMLLLMLLIDVVALTGVARASLGICASSSGGIAGQLLWKELGGDWEDCTLGTAGKRVHCLVFNYYNYSEYDNRYQELLNIFSSEILELDIF